jgi:hypothetical protein
MDTFLAPSNYHAAWSRSRCMPCLRDRFSKRENCGIVWFVAREYAYNITNLSLDIHSELHCDLDKNRQHAVTGSVGSS